MKVYFRKCVIRRNVLLHTWEMRCRSKAVPWRAVILSCTLPRRREPPTDFRDPRVAVIYIKVAFKSAWATLWSLTSCGQVLEILCQILQTDSLSTVQQWLLLAGQRGNTHKDGVTIIHNIRIWNHSDVASLACCCDALRPQRKTWWWGWSKEPWVASTSRAAICKPLNRFRHQRGLMAHQSTCHGERQRTGGRNRHSISLYILLKMNLFLHQFSSFMQSFQRGQTR